MKFIHAHQMAKNTWRNGTSPGQAMTFSDGVRELRRDGRDRDHEGEIEEELVLARRAMRLVDGP
ncbi:hypothetical protein GCM10009733_107230 [Nonomuraea maheshkhaliensis]|uniref:Uncharacterized protein n=1 Tax=Nonomuraea maheshkhaliensis TaxID=419590 RepID=A0ABN2HUW3_9ACTN